MFCRRLFIRKRFGVSPKTFFKALSQNNSADGYIIGALGEIVFEDYAKSLGYDVMRIKEKPDGGNNGKNADARGDYYIRKPSFPADKGLVIECKSVKSNAEEYTIINGTTSGTDRKNKVINLLLKFSFQRANKINSSYRSYQSDYQTAKTVWEAANPGATFPPMRCSADNPGSCFPDLSGIWDTEDELKTWVNSFSDKDFTEEKFHSVSAPIRYIQSHMPSKRTDSLGIEATGPLVTDFNIVCVDLFLRCGKHILVFANSTTLNPQASHPNHLQQNYTIDVLVRKDNFTLHKILPPWYTDLETCIKETAPQLRDIDPSQLDNR